MFASETGGFPQFPCFEYTDLYGTLLADSGLSFGFLVSFPVTARTALASSGKSLDSISGPSLYARIALLPAPGWRPRERDTSAAIVRRASVGSVRSVA